MSTINFAEKDATDDFEDVGHSDSAREMMEKYHIGEIDSSSVPAKRKYTPPQQAVRSPEDTGSAAKILQFLVPMLILGIAFAFRYFSKKEEWSIVWIAKPNQIPLR